jgi:patatin-like phospholipase/acyl hydrolase
MLERFQRPVAILSLDGGGIRGLIPTLILKDLYRRITELEAGRTGISRLFFGSRNPKPIHAYFDLITGTSTGAIIALGMTCPSRAAESEELPLQQRKPAYTLEDIENVYQNYGREIFPRGGLNNLRALAHAFEAKYQSATLSRLLESYFGDTTIDQALTEVIVPAYETVLRRAFFFKRSGRRRFRMRDVALATTAAPTYFPPALIRTVPDDGRSYSFIDGGVFANNPSLCGYVEARELMPERRHFIVLSLGTGATNRRFTHEEIRKWGYLDWVSPVHGVPLTSMMWDSQSEVVTHQLELLPEVDVYRINASLEHVSEEMDDATPKNLSRIRDKAAEIIDGHDATLEKVARLRV